MSNTAILLVFYGVMMVVVAPMIVWSLQLVLQ